MKKYLEFVAKCILAALPFILVIGYTWICPFGYMDEEFPSWHYTKEVEKGNVKPSAGEEVTLILGDSRAMADLNPTLMSEGTINLGIGGATSIEMYYTLKKYIENNGAPDNAVIMFAPFHYSYMDNYKQRTLYFHHLTLREALEVYYLGKRYNAEVVEKVGIDDILSLYTRFPDSYLPALINSVAFSRFGRNTDLYNEQLMNRGHALYGKADGCDALNYEANYTSMKQDGEHKLITRYFDMLLSLCEDNGINTILLQAPMNEASYVKLDEKFVTEYQSYIRNFDNEYPNISIEIDIPCMDNQYFGDASHLNEKGASVYTEKIVDKYKGIIW